MNVLIVGNGGREHALAWKVAQSPKLGLLYIAPGNAGTQQFGENIPISMEDKPGLVDIARKKAIDLVLVGPEIPLAAGLVNAVRKAGLRAFGPMQAATQIEASKAFAKDFMVRHHIPTANYVRFTRYEEAVRYLRQTFSPIVLKASGLAAGKGVIVPTTREQAQAGLRTIMVDCAFGTAGEEVIIEERLEGPEVSLLAFSDGRSVRVMPPAQDHKRLLDGDRGPNTGGMGAIAPAPICPDTLVKEIVRTVLQPTIDGLRAEGSPFVGVLYAGLMLTREGPRVLEFNARFGDPETQVILPLLESDLLEVMEACVEGRLSEIEVRWKPEAAACVVLASQNYPGPVPIGHPIRGLADFGPQVAVFHAGTRYRENQVVTAGGRVLGVTGWGATLKEALEKAYRAVDCITFEGMQYRKDIGASSLSES